MPGREREFREEIEKELEDLGSRVEYPPTPDLARAVRLRLDEESALPSRRGRLFLSLARSRWAAAAAMLLVVLAIPLLSSTARDTLSGWFVAETADGGAQSASGAREAEGGADRLAGSAGSDARVATAPQDMPLSSGESMAPSSGGPLGKGLGFGTRITLREAREGALAGKLLLPDTRNLGRPDEVYAGGPSRERVVLVYRAGPGLPSLDDTGIGLVLTESPGKVESTYLADDALAGIEEAEVGGSRAYWIPAGSHPSSPANRKDVLSGNVLLWERAGLALRLEADIPKQEAIRIARSVR